MPPRWRAKPSALGRCIVVCLVPDESEPRVLEAAQCVADEVRRADDLAGLLELDSDVAVVSYPLIEQAPERLQFELRVMWAWGIDPVWIVIDAPRLERLACMASGADLAVGCDFDEQELAVQILALMERVRRERDRNPLTTLPGNRWLVRYVEEMLRDDREIGLLLLDIDDFKQYNDRCGHLRGDEAILTLAFAASQASTLYASFAAHVGGDDFCVVCTPVVLDDVAGVCLSAFESQARALADRELTITLAGTVVSPAEADALDDVFQRLARLSSEGKRRPGSNYVRRDECGGDGAET